MVTVYTYKVPVQTSKKYFAFSLEETILSGKLHLEKKDRARTVLVGNEDVVNITADYKFLTQAFGALQLLDTLVFYVVVVNWSPCVFRFCICIFNQVQIETQILF